MSDWRDRLSAAERERLEASAMPDRVEPMLATLTEARFSDPDWLFERKLDGERCLALRDGRGARLFSRNDQRLDDTYPELVDALAGQAGRFVADGEVVAFSGGTTSFSRLQQRMKLDDPEAARRSGVAVFFYLFDLLHVDGYDVTGLSLRRRKALLRERLTFDDPLRFTAHRNETGEAYYERACRRGWEGVIAKRADAPYHPGRSRDWLKFKCVNQQELVVVGYTEPQGERTGFGALLLGYYEDGDLHYAGRVGTGFDEATLQRLHGRLTGMTRDSAPVVDAETADGAGVHWVRPELVVEIGFTEWTRDQRLRHPRFLGLRRDKAPGDVVRERPRGRT